MNSLARKLAIFTSIGTLVAYSVCAIVFFFVIRTFILSQFDETLESKAQALATMVSWETGFVEFDFTDEIMPEFGEDAVNPSYFQLWLEGKTVFDRSGTLGSANLSLPEPTAANPIAFWNLIIDDREYRETDDEEDLETGDEDEAADEDEGTEEDKDEEGESESEEDLDDADADAVGDGNVRSRRGRAVLVRFQPVVSDDEEDDEDAESEANKDDETRMEAPEDVEVWLMVVIDREPARQSVLNGAFMLIGLGVLLTLVIIPISLYSVRSGLRPLGQLNHQLGEIDVDHLDARVDSGALPVELMPTAERMNEFIERVESGMERERRFTSSAAHELRTPLAELRSVAEVAAAHTHDVESFRDAMKEVIGASIDLEELLEVLLRLARTPHTTHDSLRLERFSIGSIINDKIERKREKAERRGLTLKFSTNFVFEVTSDRRVVSAILCNLLTNAIRHASESTTISVSVSDNDHFTMITIANKAPDLTEDDVLMMFEPFWRKDKSRATKGTGLGLAVARALANALGGKLGAKLKNDSLVMRLTLPNR